MDASGDILQQWRIIQKDTALCIKQSRELCTASRVLLQQSQESYDAAQEEIAEQLRRLQQLRQRQQKAALD